MEEKERGIVIADKMISLEDLKSNKSAASQSVEIEAKAGDTQGSTFVDVRTLRLPSGIRIFEMDKETLLIKQARITTRKHKGIGLITYVEVKPTCRYTNARNGHMAERQFIEMLTGKKYAVWKREQKLKKGVELPGLE